MNRSAASAAIALGGVLLLALASFVPPPAGLVLLGSGVGLAVGGVIRLFRGLAEGRRETRSVADQVVADLQRRSEEAHQARRSLEAILGAMEEGVVLVEEGVVTFANPAANLLAGISEGPAGLTLPTIRRLAERAATEGAARTEEVAMGLPERAVKASAIPVGPPPGVLLVLRDVTETRRVEAMRRDFVADASHELKTPAASIQASAETLREALREDPEAAAAFAERLARDASRLSRIVADLLDLSRLEAEEPEQEPTRLDLLVREESERLRERAKEAGVELDVTTEPVTVQGDRKDLTLLVANLLDNAIRYTGRDGKIRVELMVNGRRAVLTVTDTGIGIPSRDLPRVFERFYRVDRARARDTGGTGLGLSIARHVAERHGGTIEVASELGRGSTFTVELPIPAAPP